MGLRLNVHPPGNHFPLHPDRRPAVLVAGGIGIGTRFIEAANLRLDLFYQVHLLQDRARRNDLDATWGRYEFGGDVWSFGMEGNVDW